MLAQLRLRMQIGGEESLVFGRYQALYFSDPTSETEAVVEVAPGKYALELEQKYMDAVNRHAGKQVELSVMIRELETILEISDVVTNVIIKNA
jgi:hypothetical protein